MTARKDILKPIIMFSSHADPIAPKLIINELRSLYDKGYKVICLELDKQKPVHYFLNQLKALEKAIEKEGAVRDSISALKNLIIEGRKIGFKFANIDPQSLNDALQDLMNNDAEAFEFKLNPRDTFMSREIIKYAYKYQGGVIGLFGHMHHELESLIERQLQSKAEYQNIKPVYILPRDPATIEYFETEIANNDRDLITYYSYHKDNNEDLFPPYGVHVMDESADNLENKHPIQDLLDSSYYDSRQYHTEL